MPYCTSTGLSKPYSCSSFSCRTASMPRSPANVSIGSPGTSRIRKNASSVILMKVGTISDRRVRMKRSMKRQVGEANSNTRTRGMSESGFLLLVAQLAPQDLAHRRLRQIGAELDHLRLLVAGEIGAAVVAHHLLGQV